MTIKQAAQQAIDVQDACNLSGVLGSFKTIVSEVIWPHAREIGRGTDYVNHHPICYMFLYKLMALNGHETLDEHYDVAEAECKAIAATEETPVVATV